MIASDILRGVLALIIPLFIALNQILPVYFVIFLAFAISRFFIPSKMAIIPDLVSKDKLLIANTLQDTTHMAGNVIGLMVAGFIVNIRYVGAVGGFYIDGITFFISAVFIAMIVLKERTTPSPHTVKEELETTAHALGNSLRRSVLGEIKEGIGYLMKYRDMRFIMKVFFILLSGLGAISCVIIVFIQNAFGTSTRHIGFFGTYLVCGLFLGTMLYGRLGQKLDKRRTIYASFIATGICIVLFAILVGRYPNVYLAGVLSGLIGLAVSPMMAALNTLTHETIPDEVRGRIFSSLEAVIHLAFLIFMFVAAYAAEFIDRFWILAAVGAVFFLCGMAGVRKAVSAEKEKVT